MDWSWWGSEWAKRREGREGGRELKRGGRGGREREREDMKNKSQVYRTK